MTVTDLEKSAAEAAAHEAAERFDTGTRERPLPMNAARQSAFVSGAAWQREQGELEAVAAQRAERIRELEESLQDVRDGRDSWKKACAGWKERAEQAEARLDKIRARGREVER